MHVDWKLDLMGEGFKILVIILLVMATLAEFGGIVPSLKDNFLPEWMYYVVLFYGGWAVIDMRIVPLFRDIYGLIKKAKDL